MKTTKFLLSLWLLFLPVVLNAEVPTDWESLVRIELSSNIYDSINSGNKIHRTPPRAPEIYIDGNTLFFADSCDGCTLQLLLPESDVVVFSTVIAPGTTTLTLPYEGEYTLRIIRGDYSFTGEIEI